MKPNPIFTHILRGLGLLFWPLVTALALAMIALPAFAQDGTPTPLNDLSNILNLLKYLSGPGAVLVVGLAVSRYGTRWQWWLKQDGDFKRLVAGVFAAAIALLAYALAGYLASLTPATLSSISEYFTVGFVALSGAVGFDIFHAAVNVPLSPPKT